MTEKTSRNALCPCGSGKKYKNCCLQYESRSKPKPKPLEDSDADRAALRNVEYQNALKQWRALPWTQRLLTKKPQRPEE